MQVRSFNAMNVTPLRAGNKQQNPMNNSSTVAFTGIKDGLQKAADVATTKAGKAFIGINAVAVGNEVIEKLIHKGGILGLELTAVEKLFGGVKDVLGHLIKIVSN